MPGQATCEQRKKRAKGKSVKKKKMRNEEASVGCRKNNNLNKPILCSASFTI
jgi:hypothetical protein